MDVQYIDLLKYFYDNYNQTIYFEEYFPSLISEPPNLKNAAALIIKPNVIKITNVYGNILKIVMHIVQIRFIIVIV